MNLKDSRNNGSSDDHSRAGPRRSLRLRPGVSGPGQGNEDEHCDFHGDFPSSMLLLCRMLRHAFLPLDCLLMDPTLQTTLAAAKIPDGAFGATIEVGGKPFDPLGLSEFRDFSALQRTELRNGRVAMLASTGWIWPQVFGKFDNNDVTTVDPIEAIGQVAPEAWAQIFGLMCVFESLDSSHDWSSGKALWDPAKLMPTDPAKLKIMKEKELKNGRLAMIAFASYLSAHYIPGSVPLLPANFV